MSALYLTLLAAAGLWLWWRLFRFSFDLIDRARERLEHAALAEKREAPSANWERER